MEQLIDKVVQFNGFNPAYLEQNNGYKTVGLIDMPHHVMTFLYKKDLYLIFDPYDSKIHKYRDKKSFFQGIRSLVKQIESRHAEEENFKVHFKCEVMMPTPKAKESDDIPG